MVGKKRLQRLPDEAANLPSASAQSSRMEGGQSLCASRLENATPWKQLWLWHHQEPSVLAGGPARCTGEGKGLVKEARFSHMQKGIESTFFKGTTVRVK